MDHEPVLISTIAIGLTAAFIGGFFARRIGLPVIVGYIVAGVAIGPFTPGLVADPTISNELAELGVILLMFGVGIHFSFRDLVAVRRIAVPGAAVQITLATLLGTGSAAGWCWASLSLWRAPWSFCARSSNGTSLIASRAGSPSAG